mmetsp:Transcript_88608/g.271243  ORF Transcript_88608/g.271243 Transcript_88608/m.271243 type:complete len:469 (+) Transcript_88608:382-1788(+)
MLAFNSFIAPSFFAHSSSNSWMQSSTSPVYSDSNSSRLFFSNSPLLAKVMKYDNNCVTTVCCVSSCFDTDEITAERTACMESKRSCRGGRRSALMRSPTDSCSPHSDLALCTSSSCARLLSIVSAAVFRPSLNALRSSKCRSNASCVLSLSVEFFSSQPRTVDTSRSCSGVSKNVLTNCDRPSKTPHCSCRTVPRSSSNAGGCSNSGLQMRFMTSSTLCTCRFCRQSKRPSCHRSLAALDASQIWTLNFELSTFMAFRLSRSTASVSIVFSSMVRSISPGTACPAAVSASVRRFSSDAVDSRRRASTAASSDAKSATSCLRCSMASSIAAKTPRTSSSVFSPSVSVAVSSGASSSSTRATAPSTRPRICAEASAACAWQLSVSSSTSRSKRPHASSCRRLRESRKSACFVRRSSRSLGFSSATGSAWSAVSRRRSLTAPCWATTLSSGGSGRRRASWAYASCWAFFWR